MKKNVLWGMISGAVLFVLLFFVYNIDFGTSLFLALVLILLFIGDHVVFKVKKETALQFCYMVKVFSILGLILSTVRISVDALHWYMPNMVKPFSVLTLCIAGCLLLLSDIGKSQIEKRELLAQQKEVNELISE